MRVFIFRLIGLCLLSCTLALVGSVSVSAMPARQAITVEEYWQRVNDTITTLNELKTQPDEAAISALDKLAGEWAQVDALVAPGSQAKTIPLDASFLVSKLRQRPHNLEILINIFTNLRNGRDIVTTRRFGAAQLDAIESILQGPEFQWDRPPSPIEEWWNELQARVREWLESLFGSDEISIPIPSEVFTVVAGILLALVLLYIFRSLFGDFITETSMDEERMAGDELLTAESALQKAKDISRAGDYRAAVRYLYLSALLTLDERGLLRFDRSKTNREYLRTVAAFPQLSAPLRDVIDVFDRVWYGFQPLDEASFEHYVQKVDQLREQKK